MQSQFTVIKTKYNFYNYSVTQVSLAEVGFSKPARISSCFQKRGGNFECNVFLEWMINDRSGQRDKIKVQASLGFCLLLVLWLFLIFWPSQKEKDSCTSPEISCSVQTELKWKRMYIFFSPCGQTVQLPVVFRHYFLQLQFYVQQKFSAINYSLQLLEYFPWYFT